MEESHDNQYHTRTYQYDRRDRIISRTDDGRITEVFAYDSSGNLISRKTPGEATSAAEQPGSAAAGDRATGQRSFCPDCGKPVKTGAAFCAQCGKKFR